MGAGPVMIQSPLSVASTSPVSPSRTVDPRNTFLPSILLHVWVIWSHPEAKEEDGGR